MINQFENTMPDFNASPLVDALEENLFSVLEKTGRPGEHPRFTADRSFERQPGSTYAAGNHRLSASGDPAA